MTFADVLKEEMRGAFTGTTVSELAAHVGVSTVCVQMWRNGKWLPKVPQAIALARLFGRTVESMFPDL